VKLLVPNSLDQALAMLAEHDAVPMAGGTDLLVHWPQHLAAHDRTYVDLSAIETLRRHRLGDDALILGGATTYWDIIEDAAVGDAFPLLARAARQVGAIQIQTRGTWAGNIVNASPAADGVPVLMAYDARLELVSTAGTELVSLADFYLDYKQMRRGKDQLIRAIRLPRRDYTIERFEKVGARNAQAITKVGFAVTRSTAGWRVVANSVAPTVCRCPAIEALLESQTAILSPDDLLPALDQDVTPIDDLRSTAAYRRRVLARVLYTSLAPVCPWFASANLHQSEPQAPGSQEPPA
jgi:CO/xanthine dehydrogenase FAD-binding subunit